MSIARCFVLAAVLGGCALTSNAPPVDVRYFSPEALHGAYGAAPVRLTAADVEAPKLRLGRVRSASYLRSRIVYRTSGVELGTYDDRRWTEDPDVYVRRSLDRALFHERPLAEVLSGDAPVLDVDVVAFEEDRRGAARSGRVELEYVLHDDRNVLASGRIAVERPARSSAMRDIVAAIAAALDEAAAKTADVVAARIR